MFPHPWSFMYDSFSHIRTTLDKTKSNEEIEKLKQEFQKEQVFIKHIHNYNYLHNYNKILL